jgi:hypothetical protein
MNNTGIFIWFDSNFHLNTFEKEIVLHRIRIRIEQKCWIQIRIRIKSIRIHNPDFKTLWTL